MSLRDFLQGKQQLPESSAEQKIQPPPDIDFSELWREPEDNAGGLTKVLTLVNTVVLIIIFILGFFHL